MRPPFFIQPGTHGLSISDLVKHVKNEKDARTRDRFRAILWSMEGRHTLEVAALLGKDERTIRRWFKRFEREGLEGLSDRPKSGRTPYLTEEQEQYIQEALEKTPRDYGYQQSVWTMNLMAHHVYKTFQIKIHPERIRARAHRWGFRLRVPDVQPVQRDGNEKNAKRSWSK